MAVMQLLHTITEILLANVGVTTDALVFLLEDLAAHPAAQERARQEVSMLQAGLPSCVNNASCVSAELVRCLLDRSEFLQACVLESARLRPTVPVTFPERACRSAKLGSLFVPTNVSLLLVHRSILFMVSCVLNVSDCMRAITQQCCDVLTDRGVRRFRGAESTCGVLGP